MSDTPPPAALAPSSSLWPAMGPDHVIRFHDSHRPTLPDGDYRVSVTQTLHDGVAEHRFAPAAPSAFTVAGPRFQLEPSAVHSVFPPPLADGDFEGCLPHVLLSRPTLPWERSADTQIADAQAPPWLALLLLDVEELAACTLRSVTVGELLSGPSDTNRRDAPQWPKPVRETSDVPSDPVQVIELPLGLLRYAGVNLDHLSSLAHVRVLGPQDESAPRAIETATVVGARIVRRGRSYEAHLVSVEGWCTASQGWMPPQREQAMVRLVSLYRWRFACTRGVSLRDELGALTAAPLVSGRPRTALTAPYLDRGWIPLRHEFRSGDRAVSWYCGPLTPGAAPAPADPALWPQRAPLSADELRLYELQSAMYEVSRAAAWELGRLLALQNPRIGLRLHQWKREHARYERRRATHAAHSDLMHAPHEAVRPVLDETIRHWFVTDLYRLAAVPYRYLIPDDDMLPPEGLRFFSVDQAWLLCLADGAFSVGRTSPAEAQRDAALAGVLPAPEALFGFVLRSRVLVDYPGLMLDACDAKGAPAAPVRIAHLAPGLLIALYATPIRRLALHVHPQAVHFEVPDGWQPNNPGACLNVPAFWSQPDIEHSGDLARRLQARNPRVAFELEGPT